MTSGHLGAGRLVSYLLCTAPSADLKEITLGERPEWRERKANATEREEKSHSPKSALRSSERKGRFVRNPPQSEEWLNEVGLTSLSGRIVREMSVAIRPL